MFNEKEYYKAYYLQNKDKLDQKVKEWKQSHPEAEREYSKRYREKNKKTLAEKRKKRWQEHAVEIKAWYKEYRASSVRTHLARKFSQIKKGKHRGKKSPKYEVAIDLNYLEDLWNKQKGLCAITKKKMSHRTGSLFSASIDRTDSGFGYIKGNVQLVCQAINFAKNSYSNKDMMYFWRSAEERIPVGSKAS